jgi:hypothetical protein
VVLLRSTEAHLGERRYSSYSFLTSALEGGEWSASRPSRALPPGKEPLVPIVYEAVWAPEPVWMQKLEEKSSAPVGDWTPAVQSIVRHYTDRATLAPQLTMVQILSHCWAVCMLVLILSFLNFYISLLQCFAQPLLMIRRNSFHLWEECSVSEL